MTPDSESADAFWPELAALNLAGAHASTGHRDRAERAIDNHLLGAVEALARRIGVTPCAVWSAGWALVLTRLSGQSKMGLAVRSDAGLALVKVQWREASPVLDGLVDIQVQLTDCPAHLDKVLAVSRLRPVTSGQATIAERYLPWVVEWNVGASGSLPDDVSAACSVRLDRADSHATLSAEWPSGACDSATVVQWLDHCVQAVSAMAIGGARHFDEIDVLTSAQRQQLLVAFNRTAVPVHGPLLVHQPFEDRAARQPDAVAVVCGNERLTYGALNARSNQVAHHLRVIGLKPNGRVGVCVERGIDLMVGVLAVLKAGGAYVPLDPAYPCERLQHMINDSAPVAVLTQTLHTDKLPRGEMPTLVLDDPMADWCAASSTNLPPDAIGLGPDHLAYVIYTSGSTGLPKGAGVFHRGLANLLQWYARDHAFAADDRALIVSSFSFDLTQKNLFVCLFSGGELHLAAPQFDPTDIVRTIERESITTLNLTPSAFYTIADARTPDAFNSLRRVVLGGEPISVSRLTALGAEYPLLEVINSYGPTECTDVVAAWRLPRANGTFADEPPPIGRPVFNTQLYVLDAALRPVPVGAVGEIHIGGAGVGAGYLNRPELTHAKFIANPFAPSAPRPALLYKTGDQGRWRADAALEFIGRNDFQVKIRGFRIELGEIEFKLSACPGVRDAVVVAQDDVGGGKRLVAYVTAVSGHTLTASTLRGALADVLADHMVPSVFMLLEQLPLTPNGKVDRKALPVPGRQRPEIGVPYQAPRGELETVVCAAYAAVLELDGVGRDDNFFELGGSSLLVLRLIDALTRRLGRPVTIPMAFAHATPAGLSKVIADGSAPLAGAKPRRHGPHGDGMEPIAIVGMTGRFPGAASVEQFWSNLVAGRDSITRFALDELDPSVPLAHRNDPTYVRARGVIDGAELFDNGFFGISTREAEVMDPQHRIFLELAWECLERAGYAPDRVDAPVGVFAGVYAPSYLHRHVMAHPDVMERAGDLQVLLSNDKDYVALRVAYKLGLRGPAIAVHSSCSTSLVAIAQAVDSLRLGRCDMALAGGVSVVSPPRSGYFHNDGSMLSSDGTTRTFDAQATGTVFNDGAAVVLLKRLSDAVADGDQVFAVVRGIATNNDGSGKASFTAPSVDGQAAVIAMAHADAGIEARSIGYVEAHGTATPLGDPVEVEALTKAFRLSTADAGFCRIGSVKSNVGHLVTAAGAASLIKTTLALANEQLPPTIHYVSPNPNIAFDGSPFVVNAELSPWPRTELPRRAGVSNFGVGGTNAHAVVEEAPALAPSAPAVGPQLLMLSGRTDAAVRQMAERLANHLDDHPQSNLADVAHTLQHGRSAFAHRLCVVGASAEACAAALRDPASAHRAKRERRSGAPPLIWLFPGQGAQYAGMGRGLYAHDVAFRLAFDECVVAMSPALHVDLKSVVFDGGAESLRSTSVTQPATFCLEYALARAWLARGAQPAVLVGHSVGEFVAAVLSGVMSMADAARLVALRGELMNALPSGSMVSLRLSAGQAEALLPRGLSLAADNGPQSCVVAGPTDAVIAWQSELERAGMVSRLLQTSHAFHSAMMDPAVPVFESHVRGVVLRAPQVPIVSTLTGRMMTAQDATDPAYWARHLREPVRFSPALRAALAMHPEAACLELGPRATLSALVRQHAQAGHEGPVAVPSLPDDPALEMHQFLLAQGQLWSLGVDLPNMASASPSVARRRVLLPTYPFERKRFWLEARPAQAEASAAAGAVLGAPSPHAGVPTPTSATARALVPPSEVPIHLEPALPPPTPMNAAPMPGTRRPQLLARLRATFEDVVGADLGTADATAPFVELGLDSLSLTQAALQVKRQFGVAVTFRQLMVQYRSFDALCAYLDAQLPPEPQASPADVAASTEPAPIALALPSPAVASGPPSLLQQVIAQQMQLMAQQLALLGGAGAMAQSTSSTDVVPSTASTPPANAAVHAASTAEPSGPARYDVKKAFGAIARIHTHSNEITDRQHARLDAFVRRYTERTKTSKAYTEQHRAHLADPRVVNGFRPATKEIVYQIVVDRSKGSHVWDLDGNDYVDALNGFGMSLFGWQPDFVMDAVRRQIDAGYEIGPQHPLAGEVAALVCELTGFDRAGLCNTGSEAVMAAVRIARTVTGRSMIVSFTGSYHGTFDEVLVRAGRDGKGLSAAPGILPGAFGDIRVLDYGTPEALDFIRTHADDIAAVLVEPVQSRRPDWQPREFLKELRSVTERSGVCLVFDEVITGFRAHLRGAQAVFDVRADLACYGKVIGGGFPVGVVAGRRDYMDALDGGAWRYGDESIPTVGVTYFAGTFVRHPLALAAAKASLLHLKESGTQLQTQLNLHTAALADELTAFCREVGAPLEVRYYSSLWRVSWLADHPLQDLLFAMMRSRGVHILDNFPCFLTTAHSLEDIATIKSAFKESIAELQEAEFLPRRADSAVTADASQPPVAGARLGRDKDGRPAWFVPDPAAPSRFKRVEP